MKKVDFDAYANDYNELLRENTSFFSEDVSYFARYKVRIAKELVTSPPKRILEFGCGIGRNIRFLQEAFPEAQVMGSDVSSKSLELARHQNPGVPFWSEGDLEDKRLEFDMIFVAGVFHHIPPAERNAAANAVARRLNRGGTVVVFEHNPWNPVTRKLVRDCPYDEGVLLVRSREMSSWLTGAGLQVRRRGYALFFPPWMKGLVRLEPMLAWLPLGGQYWVCANKT